jgi:hypothetical protein
MPGKGPENRLTSLVKYREGYDEINWDKGDTEVVYKGPNVPLTPSNKRKK